MVLKFPQKAFSLIELMIAISIIALISAVSIGSMTTIQKNNRDAQRNADLRLIQGALQQYYADQNHYPDTLVLNAAGKLTNCTAKPGCTPSKTYLSVTPVDPIAGTATPYCYTSRISSAPGAADCLAGTSGLCHHYELNAKLENTAGTYTCGSVSSYSLRVTPL